MQFADLGLIQPILSAVASEGYAQATPIQAQAIPIVLSGRDLLACAQTGTGKTAAFALPILHQFAHQPVTHAKPKIKALILCPTRELATQIGQSFHSYGRNLRLRNTVIFGGVKQSRQVSALINGVEIVIATPGRLLDLMNQGHVDLSHLKILVLDEADRMLDMGFIHDIRKVIARIPAGRQTLFFSATMPPDIRKLAGSILKSPANVQIAPASATAENIEESVYFVDRTQKPALLAHLSRSMPMYRAIVFTRTKHGADRLVKQLRVRGVEAEAIHGNKSQNARVRALSNFSNGTTQLLIATDIASRGIDVEGITHVINFDLTHEPETYVHRIGRTARAGASGQAISFCDHEERSNLRAIEKLIGRQIPVKSEHGMIEESEKAMKKKIVTFPRNAEEPTRPQRAQGRADGRRPHGGPSGLPDRKDRAHGAPHPHAKAPHPHHGPSRSGPHAVSQGAGKQHPHHPHAQPPKGPKPHHPQANKPHHQHRQGPGAQHGVHPIHRGGQRNPQGQAPRNRRRFG